MHLPVLSNVGLILTNSIRSRQIGHLYKQFLQFKSLNEVFLSFRSSQHVTSKQTIEKRWRVYNISQSL